MPAYYLMVIRNVTYKKIVRVFLYCSQLRHTVTSSFPGQLHVNDSFDLQDGLPLGMYQNVCSKMLISFLPHSFGLCLRIP